MRSWPTFARPAARLSLDVPARGIVLDTDIASLLHKGRPPDWTQPHIAGAHAWLTSVTVAELSKWAAVRHWGRPRRNTLDRWIAARPILPYDRAVARSWGELAAAAQLRGRPRPSVPVHLIDEHRAEVAGNPAHRGRTRRCPGTGARSVCRSAWATRAWAQGADTDSGPIK